MTRFIHIRGGVTSNGPEQVLKALAACAHFDFLEHASAHPHDTNSDYYFKVASIFEEQLQTEQGEGFTEKVAFTADEYIDATLAVSR